LSSKTAQETPAKVWGGDRYGFDPEALDGLGWGQWAQIMFTWKFVQFGQLSWNLVMLESAEIMTKPFRRISVVRGTGG
jgi:hypothetical protein